MGGSIGDDYLKNMGDAVLLNWLINRFILAFLVLFPGMKCILMLDNAGYHHAVGDKYMKLGGTKKELADKLKELGVSTISVKREGKEVEFVANSWELCGGPSTPKATELLDCLRAELPKHPEFQTTEAQRLFNDRGWQLLYTPMYTPEVQPIAKVWAFVKNIVARAFSCRRTPEKLREDLIMAFFAGDIRSPGGVTDEFRQSVNH